MRFLLLLILFPAFSGMAQDMKSRFNKPVDSNTLQTILISLQSAEHRLDRLSEVNIAKILEANNKLLARLEKEGTPEFTGITQEVKGAIANLRRVVEKKIELGNNQQHYLSALDSLGSAMKLMGLVENLDHSKLEAIKGKIPVDIMRSIETLQEKWNYQKTVEREIQRYTDIVRERLQHSGLKKELSRLNNTVNNYRKGVEEVHQIMDDPKKLKTIALRRIYALPAFNKYFAKYSQLSSLFMLPGEESEELKIEGLQTRISVDKILQETAQPNHDPRNLINQSLSEVQGILGKLKQRTEQGSFGADESKFVGQEGHAQAKSDKKFEYSLIFQSSRSGFYFPRIADIGIQITYLPKDNMRIGFALVYKAGLGENWKNIKLSHEGIGGRISSDFKVTSFGLWLTGGAELNYNQSFQTWPKINGSMLWQKVAVIGLTKDYKIGQKAKGRIQVLFDALHASHFPRTDPLIFRVGYQFK